MDTQKLLNAPLYRGDPRAGRGRAGGAEALRGETKESKIQGKIGIKVAGLGGQNEHQFEPGNHEVCMERRLGERLSFVLADLNLFSSSSLDPRTRGISVGPSHQAVLLRAEAENAAPGSAGQEANNVIFCASEEKFYTVILIGVRQFF